MNIYLRLCSTLVMLVTLLSGTAATVAPAVNTAYVEPSLLTAGQANVSVIVTEQGLGDLDDAWRITTANSPIPYSPPLEDAFLPDAERIAREVLTRP